MPSLPSTARRLSQLVCALLLVAVGANAAQAESVDGELVLPPGGTEEPEAQYVGFVARIRNPITELRPYDPRSECFVFLEGGPADPDAAKPPRRSVLLKLESTRFSPSILPVVVGSKVTVRNEGRRTHALESPDKPELFEGPPMGADGERSAEIDEPYLPIRLRSKEVPHLEGRIVGLPTRYFARVNRDGTFQVADVPPGRWTLKVWYRDGWLPTTETVEVGSAGRNTQKTKLRISLPERLVVKGSEKAK